VVHDNEIPSKGTDMNIESTKNGTPNRTRRNTAIGVTAGLLGGGAIGLLMAVPSFSSAASDDPGADIVPAVVMQDDVSDVSDVSDVDQLHRGEQLRAVLQQLVDDGTINGDQADAVTQLMIENRPERGDLRPGREHRGERGPGRDGEVVAGLLGIDVETLRTDLEAGSSIAEIATANDVDPQIVIDALVAEASGHVQLMVDDGRLTDDEAAAMIANLSDRIAARVNGEHPGRG